MGVHKLWNIVEKAGKPIRLETLQNKKLAIDALIWVYQFLKAVRNAQGENLKSSHIVGFFRRIIKLLYFGILPVFVFDGGAPYLKLNTIKKRREQREGQRTNAKATAQRLLLLQMNKLKNGSDSSLNIDRKAKEMMNDSDSSNQRFRKEDDYHLPTLNGFYHMESDKRVLSKERYDSYIQSLKLNNIENVDLDNVDPNSEEFNALPLEHQYKLLHTLRVRSRLRMGYLKEQLQQLFPNSLDFSKFQIQMVTKRNFLTQRLLNVVGLDENLPNVAVGRINNEMEKAYTLQRMKNGWELSLGEEKEGSSAENAIDVTKDLDIPNKNSRSPTKKRKREEEKKESCSDDDDFDDWEEVEIKLKKPKENFSLNSLPLPPANTSVGGNSFLSLNNHLEVSDINYEEKYKEELQKALKISDLNNQKFDASLKKARVISKAEYEKNNDIQYNADLKKAIEASKKDLDKIREEHEMFLNEDLFKIENNESHIGKQNKIHNKANAAPKSLSLNFKESIFAKHSKDEIDSLKLDNISRESLDHKDNEKEKAREIPSWFDNTKSLNDSNNIKTVHFENQFLNNDKQISMEIEAKELQKKGEDELIKDFHYAEDGKYYKEVETAIDKEGLEDQQVLVLNSDSEAEVEVFDKSKLEEKFDKTIVDKTELMKDTKSEMHPFVAKGEDKDILMEVNEKENVKIATERSDFEVEKPDNKNQIKYYDFNEDEEEELIESLSKEAEVHSDFTTNLKEQYKPTTKISTQNIHRDEFNPTKNYIDYTMSIKELEQKKKQQMRDSDEVTDIMIEEVKNLLTCFGIPYIVSPMEAEAQCAVLLKSKLVDGIVTDDSDCFLFGGSFVYRHLFVEKKFAELYQMEAIQEKCDLNREDLISLAYLLGSDYTEGLKGIGPVNAMKILKIFGGNLSKFKEWFNNTMDDKKFYDQLNGSIKERLAAESFLKSLKKRMIKSEISIDDNFPSTEVKNAYLYPEVDEDETQFVWGTPDLDMLRDYLLLHVGWNKQKVDEILIPLMRRYNSPFKVKRK